MEEVINILERKIEIFESGYFTCTKGEKEVYCDDINFEEIQSLEALIKAYKETKKRNKEMWKANDELLEKNTKLAEENTKLNKVIDKITEWINSNTDPFEDCHRDCSCNISCNECIKNYFIEKV